jgi:hypothetical protein
MNAVELLKRAEAEGVLLTIIDGRLIWDADHNPPIELLEELKSSKQEVIDALRVNNDVPPQSRAWLENIAQLLNCSADYLITHGFIDQDDLHEQYQMPPRLIVRLISTHPLWKRPNEPI